MFADNILLRSYRLLDDDGRRDLARLAVVFFVTGIASAAMVASVFPFLTLLSDPDALQKTTWLAYIYERFGFSSQQSFLQALGAAAILVTASANGLILLRTYLLGRFIARQNLSLSKRLFEGYLGKSYPYFLSRHSGDLTARVLGQSSEVIQNAFRPIAEAVSSAFSIVSIVAALIWLNPLIAFGALVVIGGAYGLMVAASRSFIRRLGRTRAIANEKRHRVVSESLGTIKTVKLYGLEIFSSDMFETPARQFADTEISMGVVTELPRSVILTIALASVIILSLLIVSDGTPGTATGDLLPLLGVLGLAGMRLQPEVQKLYSAFTRLQFGRAAFDRIAFDLTEYEQEDEALPAASDDRLRLHRNIELKGITYRYPSTQDVVIADVGLTIRAGQRIGLVGATGAGKSTLVDVLLGLLPPDSGEVIVDGHRICETNLRSWRKSVGYVPQEINLRDADIAENIAYGEPPGRIDLERVRHVAGVARISDFIERQLPDGYHSGVGERGVRLSGGQRQRIAIARALYRDADLIVFDEATSALDNMTENEIMTAIKALPGDKTILLIAHRLSTVRGCDCIHFLERGRIVASGDWDTLMRDCGPFRALAKTGFVSSPDGNP